MCRVEVVFVWSVLDREFGGSVGLFGGRLGYDSVVLRRVHVWALIRIRVCILLLCMIVGVAVLLLRVKMCTGMGACVCV